MHAPSAVLPEESNVILNPRHPGFGHVELTIVRLFSFDQGIQAAIAGSLHQYNGFGGSHQRSDNSGAQVRMQV
jgi:hypothetical protein